jgi:hypothetical protein
MYNLIFIFSELAFYMRPVGGDGRINYMNSSSSTASGVYVHHSFSLLDDFLIPVQVTANGSPVAYFHTYRRHLFSENEPATLWLSGCPQDTEIFRILVLLYSEMRRCNESVCPSWSFLDF